LKANPRFRPLLFVRSKRVMFERIPTIMTKSEFHSNLQAQLAKGAFTMPFWASGKRDIGHPLEAKLVIIGYNPSSSPSDPWSVYWDPYKGFNMGKYQQNHPRVSPTRRNIYRLVKETIGPEPTYVNTNIFWTASRRKKDLKDKTQGNLLWLMSHLRSDIIVVTHGKFARSAYEGLRQGHRHLPEAISCPVHLSGMGAAKGVSFNDEFAKLKAKILAKLLG
jgi:hypothetical protein